MNVYHDIDRLFSNCKNVIIAMHKINVYYSAAMI